jgi:hypothetical protein
MMSTWFWHKNRVWQNRPRRNSMRTFYTGTSEAKLVDLTSVRQTCDDSVLDYFKWFKETKNRCFNLSISEKVLADLAFQRMHSYLIEKLEGHIYLSLTQLQQFASVQENWIKSTKEIVRPWRHEVHVVEHSLDSLGDESSKVLMLSSFGHPRPNPRHAMRWSRFIKIGKIILNIHLM